MRSFRTIAMSRGPLSARLLMFAAAAALAAAPALTAGVFGDDPAFAHPGNGNGGGNGDGPGGGNGNGPGGGNGNGPGGDGDGPSGGNGHANMGAPAAASIGASPASVTASAPPGTQGSIASMLGALNAAHASKTALAHANRSSRVGRIAAYNAAVSKAEQSVDVAQANLAAARQALAMNPTNPALQAAVTQDQATLAAARKTFTRTEFTFARRAANKSVTPTVISALNGLLGIR